MSYASILYASASGTTFALTNSDGDAIEYLKQNDIAVYVNDVLQTAGTDYTFNSAGTSIILTSAVSSAEVYIIRTTDITEPVVDFTAGSTLTSTDLNNSNDQYRFALQEFRDTYAALTQGTDDLGEFPGIIDNTETWVSDDSHWATTAAMDSRFVDQVNDETIAGVKTFSSSPIVPTPSSGTQATNKAYVDDNYWNVDGETINLAEQNAGSPAWDDNRVATAAAASRRFDTLVQTATPTDTNYAVGKTWLQNDTNNTVSIWDGDSWVGVASGGTFTTQNTVIYVDSINGNDANDGHRIINPMRTIRAAVASADAGDIIIVVPGVYQEQLPIDIEVANLSIVGQSIRSCFIHPTAATETNTMFRCNSGTYIANFTFAGLKATGTRGDNADDADATFGLPENQGWVAEFFPNAVIRKSPYIQNCTNFADDGIDNDNFDPNNFQGTGGDLTSNPTGGGILVDGAVPDVTSPLRSFVVDSFTQVCLDGPGVLVTNNGYAQLVSFFGTFCHYHAKALNGGQINLSNCTTDFGRFGLIADGRSPTAIFTATANGAAAAGATTFTINEPTDLWFGTATRPLDNMLVEIGGDVYPILSSTANGTGWDVEILNPDPANLSINAGLDNPHADLAPVSFFLRSLISTSGHTFEYVGSGTNYTALPQNGGVPVDANQSVNRNDGQVWLSGTDQNGRFLVGDTFTVDQRSGFVNVPAAATNAVTKTGVTGAALIPAGTQAQRPTGATGHLRFNTDTASFEGFDGTDWGALGGAAADVPFTPGGDIAATNVQDAIDELDDEKVPRTSTTGAAILPSGTDAQRDGSPAAGYIRFNTTSTTFEGHNGTAWGAIGGGATGGGSDAWALEHDNTITTDYTIGTGKNVISAGPMTINSGVTVTTPSGSTWTVV